MVDQPDNSDARADRPPARAGQGKLGETKIALGETKPSIERPQPKPSQLETKVGIADTRPSIERVETKEEGEISPVEATMPSSDDLAFRVEDKLDYDHERDSIESMLFGTPVTTHRIGRFAILGRLGQGAMGTVYTAYDEELDRRVAVKVLRYAEEQQEGGTASARLLREAQAMARLSHPNIVGVHEVGRHEGRVFVAMEFIRGASLDKWLREGEQARAWPEVLEVFRQAGEGLAAAHAAGVVHRDFKPHNVIRGDDGVVRVLDFGLARQVSRADIDALGPAEFDGAMSVAAAGRLTATGAVMGTPAYMAPEQCLGEVAGAHSDQFGFCVALYEGLYRQLPFAGDNFYELFANVTEGKVREPSKDAAARVPAWIHRIVMRGLSTAPEQRFASMRELVDALGRDPAVARKRWLGVAGIALGAAAASVGLTLALQGPAPLADAPCTEIAAGLAEVYTDTRKQRAEQAMLATGLAYASDTWSRIVPRIDSYASAWIEHSESVCLAHHDERLSTALFDRASACLAERRASLDALLGLLERADATTVEQAADVVAALPGLAACADERWLSSAVPLPSDPERARAVQGGRESLAASMVLHHAGQSEAAREQLDGLAGREDAAFSAELALARGTIALDNFAAEEADAALSEAISSAMAIGHTQVTSEAVSRRLFVRGVLQQRLDEAAVDQGYGQALAARLAEPSLRWLYYNNAAALMQTRDELEGADALYARALAELDADSGAPSFEAAATRSNRAQLALLRQDFAAALEGQREAVELVTAFYGAEHPMVANFLYVLASLERDVGALDAAQLTIGRALALHEAAAVGPELLRMPLRLAAQISFLRRDYAAAKATAERALAGVTRPDFLSIISRHVLADALIGLGEHEAGIAAHLQALAEAEQFYADAPGEIALSHEYVSDALLLTGDIEGGGEHARLAVARREASPSTPPADLASALIQRGRSEVAANELARARASLERARALLPEASPLRADVWTALAEVAEAEGDDEASLAARQEALEALESTRGAGDPELALGELALATALARSGGDHRPMAARAQASLELLGSGFADQLAAAQRLVTAGGDR